MKSIGNALSFYCQYPAEMKALYFEKEYGLIDNNEETIDKIEEVGEAASEDIKNLLLKITNIIKEKVSSRASVKAFSKQTTMREQWKTELHVWEKKVKERPEYVFHSMGTSIRVFKGKVHILLWAWSRKQELSDLTVLEKLKEELSEACSQEDFLWDEPHSVVLGYLALEAKQVGQNYVVDEEMILNYTEKVYRIFCEKFFTGFIENRL